MRPPDAVLTRVEDLAPLAGAWRSLAEAVAETSYFGSPDWVLAWWETLGGRRPAEVAVWMGAAESLEAVVPLARPHEWLHHRVPLPTPGMTNLGSGVGAADHCGFAVSPSRTPDVRAWLHARSQRTSLLLRNLDQAYGRPCMPPGARLVARTPCPRLQVPDSPDALGSAGFRKKLRYYTRRLADDGVTFRWVTSETLTMDMLNTLFALHRQRQDMAGRRSSFDLSKRPLHTALVERGARGRGPVALVAERGGKPVAMLYGFRWRDTFAYYQSGWEPELARLSIGTVLVAQAIGFAAADGARVFDFLRGAESYKYRFGALDRYDETWLLPHGAGGALLALRHRVHGALMARREVHSPSRSPVVGAGMDTVAKGER